MSNINYDNIFKDTVKAFDSKKSLILQACCAPCSSAVLERVTPYFDVTLYFYNPNITDKTEYDLRLSELYRFVGTVYAGSVKVVDGGYNPQVFYEYAKGKEDLKEGGERCFLCYNERLKKTAEYCKQNNFDYFGTTLTVSPYKNAEKLNEIGISLESEYNVNFLRSDFKKGQGYVRSIELSKIYNLYRQDYCGCEYSRLQRELLKNKC